jgi:hypothetical protein
MTPPVSPRPPAATPSFPATVVPATPLGSSSGAGAGSYRAASSPGNKAVAAIMYGFALVLFLLSALPYGVLAWVRPEIFPEQTLSLRVGSATVGGAIALGATVALFF